MNKKPANQINKVITVYKHHYSKIQQKLFIKKQKLREARQKLGENSQIICQLEAKLKQTQKELITTGQLSQWQAYQDHSKSQRVLIGEIISKKSKLEIQVAISQEGVDKTLENLHRLKHKCEVISKLKKQLLQQSTIKVDELDDESSTQQWQLA